MLLLLSVLGCVALAQSACPAHWVEKDGSCWFASHEKLKWTSASSACQAFGGELAVIPDMQIYNDIKSLVHRGEKVWVDGTDMMIEGTWEWASLNQDIDFQTLGVSSVRDNDKDKNCLYLDRDDHFRMKAESCDSEAYFVCEHRPTGGSSILG